MASRSIPRAAARVLAAAAHAWVTPLATARLLRAALQRSSLDAWLGQHQARWSYHHGLAGQRATISALRRLGLSTGPVLEGSPPSGGGLLVFLHSPWWQAVASRLAADHDVLAIGSGNWPARLGPRHVAASPGGAHRLHRHLRAGGLAALAIDRFANNAPCSARFLGFPVRVHTDAARLARLAGVPLVPMDLNCRAGLVHLNLGPKIQVHDIKDATREALAYFEPIVRERPVSWSLLRSFLRGWSAATSTSAGSADRYPLPVVSTAGR